MMAMTWWQAYITHLLYEIETLFSLHRRAACIMLLLPVVYTLLFGGLFYENTVTHVPVIVCNLDRGASGRQLVQDIAASPDLRITGQINTPEDASHLLARTGNVAVIVIPDDFSQRIAGGDTPAVSLTVDNGNTVLGGVAARAVQQVVSTWDGRIIAQWRMAAGWQDDEAAAALTLSSRVLGNPAGGYEAWLSSSSMPYRSAPFLRWARPWCWTPSAGGTGYIIRCRISWRKVRWRWAWNG